MKTKQFFLMSCIVSLTITSFGQKNKINELSALQTKTCAPVTTTITGEDKIFLEVFPVDTLVAVTHIDSTKCMLLCNGLNTLSALGIETITAVALNDFRKIATQIVPTSTSCTNFITGIRIIYGLQDNKILAFYRPVLGCRSNTLINSSSALQATYAINEGTEYYQYTPTGFLQAKTVDDINNIKSFIQNYSLSIVIKESTSTRTFNPAQDSTGDVTSVIFPFQELFAITDVNVILSICLWNSIRWVSYNHAMHAKHSILLSPSNITALPFAPPVTVCDFKDSYANLGHLCPPSCGSIYFRLRN
jgi:hypothetical protein